MDKPNTQGEEQLRQIIFNAMAGSIAYILFVNIPPGMDLDRNQAFAYIALYYAITLALLEVVAKIVDERRSNMPYEEMTEIQWVDVRKVRRINTRVKGMLNHWITYPVAAIYRHCLKSLELWEEDGCKGQ